jgi:hypothetical protein
MTGSVLTVQINQSLPAILVFDIRTDYGLLPWTKPQFQNTECSPHNNIRDSDLTQQEAIKTHLRQLTTLITCLSTYKRQQPVKQ